MYMDSGPTGAFTKTMIVSVEEGLVIITAAKEHL
jgi:hypothetical protein